ncbi:unnamed protein product [Meloidogyne enterolobii]|uniref:Uncharacterized protein n=1 Tax=Meloidogyne enterolobii TaxID=390850 RepID=A0ACB0Z037_MELEN
MGSAFIANGGLCSIFFETTSANSSKFFNLTSIGFSSFSFKSLLYLLKSCS